MAVSYNRLWKLLIDKNMSVAEMRRAADIAPNTVTRMKKDQEVTMSVLEKICAVLDADFGDIVEYVKDAKYITFYHGKTGLRYYEFDRII